MSTHDTAQLVEKGAEAALDDSKDQDRSGIPGASFNIANSILGSGIIGTSGFVVKGKGCLGVLPS